MDENINQNLPKPPLPQPPAPKEAGNKKKVLIVGAVAFLILALAGGGWYFFLYEGGSATEDSTLNSTDNTNEEQEVEVVEFENEYVHPVDGYSFRYPEGAEIDVRSVMHAGYKHPRVDSSEDNTLVEVEGIDEWGVYFNVFPSDWYLIEKYEAYREELKVNDYSSIEFKGADNAYRVEMEDEGSEDAGAMIVANFGAKTYIIVYGAEGNYALAEEIAYTFEPGHASAADIGSYYTHDLDVGIKNDIAAYSNIAAQAKKEDTLPSTAGMVRIDRNTGIPQGLEDVFDDPGLGLPPEGSPSSFYGFKHDGENYEFTAALDNKYDPECVVEGDFCIYRVVNGEVVSFSGEEDMDVDAGDAI